MPRKNKKDSIPSCMTASGESYHLVMIGIPSTLGTLSTGKTAPCYLPSKLLSLFNMQIDQKTFKVVPEIWLREPPSKKHPHGQILQLINLTKTSLDLSLQWFPKNSVLLKLRDTFHLTPEGTSICVMHDTFTEGPKNVNWEKVFADAFWQRKVNNWLERELVKIQGRAEAAARDMHAVLEARKLIRSVAG